MIPICETDSCINGTCNSSDGKCDCVAGYEGSQCQDNIDDCAKMPCQHNGTCTDELNDYECQCPTNYLEKKSNRITKLTNTRYIQWNLSNPTHKETREICRIV
jgi:hypothetical protein